MLKNKFVTSPEELKKQGVVFLPHNPRLSKDYSRWQNKDRVWNLHLKNKGETNEKMDNE